jgi:hypothetical protein
LVGNGDPPRDGRAGPGTADAVTSRAGMESPALTSPMMGKIEARFGGALFGCLDQRGDVVQLRAVRVAVGGLYQNDGARAVQLALGARAGGAANAC